jgi:PKHD-type hydroxylase
MEKLNSWYLQSKQFESYACIENAFTAQECEEIKKYCDSLIEEEAKIGDNHSESGIHKMRKSQVSWLDNFDEPTKAIYRKLTDYVIEVNKQIWNFDLDYIEPLQYTKYTNLNDRYGYHIDIPYDSQHYRKLSFSLQLNDERDYRGCDLKLKVSSDEEMNIKISRKQGSLNFFPSFTLHEVTPLEAGQRCSLVGWVCGPRFK